MSEMIKDQERAHQNVEISDTAAEATLRQQIASAPEQSVWVGASAGTGKTKVLTDRVLRLLLPSEISPGTEPHKILCITFTKAAAAEMALRVSKVLGQWAVANEEKLEESLTKLLGKLPDDKQKEEARKLFAKVVDAPGGLNIQTIHAFCESVLRRFPVEAGLPPAFEVIEEARSKLILKQAQNKVFSKIINGEEPEFLDKIKYLSLRASDDRLLDLINTFLKERRALSQLFEQNLEGGLYTGLMSQSGLDPNITEDMLYRELQKMLLRYVGDVESILPELDSDYQKTGQNLAGKLRGFVKYEDFSERLLFLEDALLTKEKKPRSFGKTVFAPHIQTIFNGITDELVAYRDKVKRLEMVRGSSYVLEIVRKVLDVFVNSKYRQGLLDFDDLIETTANLLRGRLQNSLDNKSFEWILYKLDYGIDHVLVDEAQDTNPDQWEIISTIANAFMEGLGARENTNRTLFVVGDRKQSIYSFQRADPDVFEAMRLYFGQRMSEADRIFKAVDMNISFRSVPAILNFVDRMFESEMDKKGVVAAEEDVKHSAHRHDEPGLVELWPIIYDERTETGEAWPLPETDTDKIASNAASSVLLAEKIAGTVKHWLDSGRYLPSKDRAVEAGDILILLRKRGQLQGDLVRALKSRNINVEGLDRLILQEHIAIQDLLAAGLCALDPVDDYTLACLLKSPFVGWHDEELMELSLGRTGTLYREMEKRSGESDYAEILSWLKKLSSFAQRETPYSFFATLLSVSCPADKTGSGWRAIHKRLGEEAFDPVETFLGHVLDWKSSKGRTGLLAFIEDMKREKTEIKREMEEGAGRVRIMTVHGSKGLQAPIVFLADTAVSTQGGNKGNQISSQVYWPAKTGLDFPFWAPGGDTRNSFSDTYKDMMAEKAEEEGRRLLYVAMTRAEDELYICGHMKDGANLSDTCWYALAEKTMKALQASNDVRFEAIENDGTYTYQDKGVQIQENKQAENQDEDQVGMPGWVTEILTEEEKVLKSVQPSRPVEDEPAVFSPLATASEDRYMSRFHRGNIIHTALQFLPDLDKEKRADALKSYLSQKHLELEKVTQEEMAAEILNLLDDPLFKNVFGPNSRAEIPVTGVLGGNKKVSGQIDRLVIEKNRILIVDFKTNRPPPDDERDVPQIYRDQLTSYHDIMSAIHPDKEIICGLLWTSIPKFMRINIKK